MSKVDFNTREVGDSLRRGIDKVQVALDVQIAKDSNYYCPVADGTLRSSVLRSDFGSGKLVWDTDYAEKQYYGYPNKSTDVNPNARMQWFEEAKAQKKKEWEALANEKFNR